MIDKDSPAFRKASAAYFSLPSRRSDGKYNDCRDRLAAALEVWDQQKFVDWGLVNKAADDAINEVRAMGLYESYRTKYLSKTREEKAQKRIGSGFLRLAENTPLSRIRKRAMRSLSLQNGEEQRGRVQADV